MAALLNSGSQLGFAAGAGMVALTSAITTSYWGENAMLEGGWRIPFLLALPLGILAVVLRSKTPESPSFEVSEAASEDADQVEMHPMFERHGLKDLLRRYCPMILIGVAIIAADGSSSYMLASYMPTFIEVEAGVHAADAAVAAVVVLLVQAVLIALFGMLSDKIGRRPVYFMAAGGNLILLFPAFTIAQLGTTWFLYAALFMLSIPARCSWPIPAR